VRSNSLSDLVGWTVFESPKTLAQWDGSFMATLSLRAPDLDLSPKTDRVSMANKIGNVCRSLGHRWTWHFESQNTKLSAYQEAEWPSLVSAVVDAERRETCLADGAQFEMRHYLTLTQSPAITAALGSMLVGGNDEDESARDRRRASFERQVQDIVGALEATGMRVEWMNRHRTATYLKSTCSTNHHKVNADEHHVLSDSLPDQLFQRGFRMSKLGDNYIAVMTLGALPKETTPQLLSELAKLRFEFRWVTRFVGMERAAARALLRKREEQALGAAISLKDVVARKLDGLMAGGNNRGIRSDIRARVDGEEIARADDAAAGLKRLSERGHGHMTVVLVVWDKSRRICDEKRSALMTAIQACDLTVRHEIIEPIQPWLMSLPGNRLMTRRTHVTNTRNLADVLPTSSLYRGSPHDLQLAKTTGVRRAWLYAPGYRLNTDSKGGAAHTIVFGRTGEAGKSTLLNHMGLQFFGWPRAQVISLSVGRSEYGPCLMSGGAVYAPGSRDEAALQPLAYVDKPDEAVEAVQWLEECVVALGETVTTEVRAAIADVVKMLAGEPPERRTMTSVINLLGSRLPSLAEVLKPFSHYGMYGHIFDGNNAAALDWKPWTMIELAPLLGLDRKVSGPALSHLCRRIFKRFDGRPTAVFADEVPDWVGLPGVEQQLIRIGDTQRKNNVRLVLVAQTPGQMLKFPGLLASVKSGVASRIYGPEPNALSQADAFAEFSVTPTQLERISKLQLGQYMHSTGKNARVFDLHAGPAALALTTMSSPGELAFLAELRASGCDGDEITREVLRRKGLERRAKELGVWANRTTAIAAE